MSVDESGATRVAWLVARLVLGIVFVMHGWQKYDDTTIDGVELMFRGLDVPFAYLSAVSVTLLELVGGVGLILGVLVRPLAVLFVLDMLGAIWFTHLDAGFFVADGGYEFVLVLAMLSGLFAVIGGGRYSIDTWLHRGRTRVSSMAG